MIKAVVLALEDVLLHGANNSFPAMLEASGTGAPSGDPEDRLASVLASAQDQLLSGRDMMTPNADVLTDWIASQLSISQVDAESALQDYFESTGRRLEASVRPDPCASQLVGELVGRGLAVAIAMDPLYPEKIVRQWLGWAGLRPFFSDLAFVAHSGNTHYVKPDPAYFAEIVARIGVEPDETLLLANSLARDISPARMTGLPSWRVTPATPLAMFLEYVQTETWQDGYLSRPLTRNMLEPQYQGNIAALYGLLAEVKPHQWIQKPDPDEWSILQILCHLLDAEVEVHRHRLTTILREETPFIRAPAPPGPDLPTCHEDGYAVMRLFHEERKRTMSLLAGLSQDDWRRPARHSIFGLTNMLEMAYFTAQHDRLHINQLCQTLGKCN